MSTLGQEYDFDPDKGQEYDRDYEASWPNVDGESPEAIIPVKSGRKPYADKARDKARIRKTYGVTATDRNGFPIVPKGKDETKVEHRPSRMPNQPKRPSLGRRFVQHLKDSFWTEAQTPELDD